MKIIKYFSVKEKPFDVYGHAPECFPEHFRRMPDEVAAAAGETVRDLAKNGSGIRVRFSTDSETVSIRVKLSELTVMPLMTAYASAGFDLYEMTKNGTGRFVAFFNPENGRELLLSSKEYESHISVGAGGMRFYQINFPLYSSVDSLEVGIDEGAILENGAPYKKIKPFVIYGSSITQGASASRPGLSHAAIISRRLCVDFRNLGFSGACNAEPCIADYLASLDPSVYVIEYDHNSPVEILEERHAPLVEKIRSAHPETPTVLVTRPDFFFTDEDERRRRAVFSTFEKLRAAGDKNVSFIDGAAFFPDERGEYTVDNCHPNDAGIRVMANVLTGELSRIYAKTGDL